MNATNIKVDMIEAYHWESCFKDLWYHYSEHPDDYDCTEEELKVFIEEYREQAIRFAEMLDTILASWAEEEEVIGNEASKI